MPRRLLTFLAAAPLLGLPGLCGCGSSFFQSNTTAPGCSSFFHSPSCDSSGGSGGGTGASNYAFVVNSGGSTVSGLGITTAGALAALSGSPISITSSPPTAAAVTRNNSFLYVGNASQIFGYAISSAGALTALNGGSALATVNVTDMQVTPDGKWLMVLDSTGAAIDLFAINSTTGALASANGVNFTFPATGTVPYHLSINPAGTAVAATLGLGGQILWSFNSSNGGFTELSRTAAVNALTADRGLAWDQSGNYLFLTRTGTSQGLIVESVAANGALTPTTTAVYSTGGTPTSVALDNTGKYVYVTNQADSTITGYAIGTNEALTPIAGSPFSSGIGATSIGMDSTGKWVLVASTGGSPDLTLYGFDASNPGRLYVVSSTSTGLNANFVALSH
ncbi:lactonase family protein [Terriglobus sp.]|uniref:lactonase family protein n=1 Tax=Terriglobus sp. TaxID=1889013 RepID=UPI003AFF73B7